MAVEPLHIALAGNPNCGKSTLFNALTGLSQKVANYPGVTVEKKEGELVLGDLGTLHVIDLPGTYSLTPHSLDEQVAHDVILGLREDTPRPGLVVAVVDASNLERHLFFVSQLLTVGCPMVVALNMMDLARQNGCTVNASLLEKELGVPVIPMSANRGQGFTELREAMIRQIKNPVFFQKSLPMDERIRSKLLQLRDVLFNLGFIAKNTSACEMLRFIGSDRALSQSPFSQKTEKWQTYVEDLRKEIDRLGLTWHSLESDVRYLWIESVLSQTLYRNKNIRTLSDQLDAFLIHRILGPIILTLVMLFVFIAIFKFAQYPMDGIKEVFDWMAKTVKNILPAGPLESLLSEGIMTGVGSILVFLPQIMLLFFFLAILEDSGYMARAAFIMDRIMGRVGLHGKAFIPLLSSFSCAIPGVMATRTMENAKDRLVTILVAPLMCCSARWPVYFLLAGSFIPSIPIMGWIPLPSFVIFLMVVCGAIFAIVMVGIFKRTLFKGETPPLILELPPYRCPTWSVVLRVMLERGWLFVKNAGTVILCMSIILWALSSYPRREGLSSSEQIQQSYVGKIGKWIEPVIKPLGFDWKIGIAIISSFAAREVFVSTMGTIYGVEMEDSEQTSDLRECLKKEIDVETGKPFYTPARAISLMVFYMLAMQCISTMAVVRRETNSWKWVAFQWLYMTILAWCGSFLVWNLFGK